MHLSNFKMFAGRTNTSNWPRLWYPWATGYHWLQDLHLNDLTTWKAYLEIKNVLDLDIISFISSSQLNGSFNLSNIRSISKVTLAPSLSHSSSRFLSLSHVLRSTFTLPSLSLSLLWFNPSLTFSSHTLYSSLPPSLSLSLCLSLSLSLSLVDTSSSVSHSISQFLSLCLIVNLSPFLCQTLLWAPLSFTFLGSLSPFLSFLFFLSLFPVSYSLSLFRPSLSHPFSLSSFSLSLFPD